MTDRIEVLSGRQREVVDLVARGLPNKEIAARLGVTRRAVEALLTRIYEKLAVDNRAALIAFATLEAGVGVGTAHRDGPRAAGGMAITSAMGGTAAYENVPFMVAVTHGPDHRFTFVNRVAATAAGRPAHNLIGRTVREIYPDIGPRFPKALDDCYQSGLAVAIGATRARWSHEDGSFRNNLVHVLFQPLRDATGAVVRLLHIGTETEAPGN